MIEITFLITGIYVILISFFIKGWFQIRTFRPDAQESTNLGISVVVACRNEAKNLPTLLEILRNQTNSSFQLILIDDHSTDDTFEIMKQDSENFKDSIVLKSAYYGKKQALKAGIEKATNDFILTTDADCSPTPRWIETMLNYQEKTNSDMIIGPVAIRAANSHFERMQQVEFLSLVISGAGALGIGQPILCNGANLAFKKQKWLDNFEKLQLQSNSGDDVFLLHALKAQNGKINFLKSKLAIVSTNACYSITSFLEQRKRWASKAPLYTDFATIFVALIVFFVSLWQLILLVGGLFQVDYLKQFAILSISKLLVDAFFLVETARFFEQKINAKTLLTLAALYPFYIIFTALKALAKKNYK